ncbi:hypothetical protein BH10ACT1_BH10ACT1_18160 [soil metagenome]
MTAVEPGRTLRAIAPPTRSRPALVLVAATAVALAAVIPLAVTTERADVGDTVGEWVVACFAPGFAVSGWWLARRRPRSSLGWLFLAAGLSVALAGLAAAAAGAAVAEGRSGADWGLWVFSWLWQPHAVLLGIALLLFPDGQTRGRWHRALVWAMALPVGISMLVSALQPGLIVTTPDHLDGSPAHLANPLGIDAIRGLTDAVQGPLLAVNGLTSFIPIVWAAWWWRRSDGVRRRQFRWVTLIQLATLVAPALVFSVPGEVGPALAILATLATQLLVVVAILQWQAYDVQVVVRRSVLSVAFVATALGLYAVAAFAVSIVVGSSGTVPAALGATAAILAFGPLSTQIRRQVNRLLYGRRDDPYAVVSELGRQLSVAADPAAGLASVAVALTAALRLPYAAIVARDGTELAADGELEPGDRPEELTINHHGTPVASLLVGHRRGSTDLTAGEADLLANLAHQIGATVAASELLGGLRAAQERLVLARHDERRRIQRDLHDGLGPELTAVMLKLDAARNHLALDPAPVVDELVGSARADIARAFGDVRRLVYSLGDPTLASLGLSSAISDQVQSLTGGTGLDLTVTIGDLDALPAATEEAVLRIVVEAVTNVVRHAASTACTVHVSRQGDLLVASVSDDGCGISPSASIGVGRRSMQDRAQELAGELLVATPPACGTVVTLRLPLGAHHDRLA